MGEKPTYEELEQRVKEFEKEAVEHKTAQQALQLSEQQLSLIYDSIADILFYIKVEPDDCFRFLSINQTFLKATGLMRDQIVGKRIEEVVPETSVRLVLDNYKKAIEENRIVRWEETSVYPAGEKLGEVSIAPVLNEKGICTHLVGSVHDVTERKQAEEGLRKAHDEMEERVVERTAEIVKANEQLEKEVEERKQVEETLRESEERFRLLSEASFEGIAITENGKVLIANRQFSEMVGYKLSEVIGRSALDFVAPESRDIVLERIRSGYEEPYEHLGLKKDSSVFDIEVHGKTIPYEGRDVRVTAIRDITERKRAGEALKESEKKYKELADSLPQVVFEMDTEGNLTYASRVSFDLFGYTQQDFDRGLNALQMLIPEDQKRSLDNIRRVLKGETLGGQEYTARRKDGRTFPVIVHSNRIVRDGKPIGLRGIIVDLSKLKLAEEALRESEEKLARSMKMESLGLLAGGVAHDLNNVLSGIVSYPELILIDLPEDSKLRKPIETMQKSGHRAVAIIQDLLTVARGVATTKEPLNLNDLVDDYLDSPEFINLEQFHPTVTVKTNLGTDLFNIGGSPVHIRKVVMNLVSNASESIEGVGNVTISTMNRYVDRPLRGYDDVSIGEYAVLSVSDDGSGISSDDLERIFEPFYTKKVMGRSGTGLGLAVVWNVVQDHKGYIDVIADENGTTFELYFPITRYEISDKDLPIPIKDYKGDGETILVVDDVESQREISCNMLDTLGYKTRSVSSGEEAVEYLKENTVDLLLLDMIMDPGINGRETYERVIKIHPKQKAIIVSGFAETDEVKEAKKLGVGQYIKKPIMLEKIGLAVKEELVK